MRNMTEYKSYRFVDGKARWIIVDKNGTIKDRSPSKDKLKHINNEPRSFRDTRHAITEYTDKELLEYLKDFYETFGKVPAATDFVNNTEYPSWLTFANHFGSWSNALKLVGFDVDSMVKKGIFETECQKARLAEIKVINHFKKHPIDLAGENHNNPCDGVCPNGMTYDVKSSKFYTKGCYLFTIYNKYKCEIEIFYLLAFNKDYTELEYAWRVPGDIIEKDWIIVGLSPNYKFNIEDMEQYNITDIFSNIIVS